MNAQEVDKPESMTNGKYSLEKLEGTPFNIVGNPEKGYCLTLGNYRISEFKEYAYDVEKLLHEDQWNIVMSIIMIVNDLNLKKEKTETKH